MKQATIEPLLKKLLESKSPEAIEKASAAIEELGLGALPAVSTHLESLPGKHPGRERLSKLASRLACIVSDFDFSKDSLARPRGVIRAAIALQRQPLTEKAFVEFLMTVQKHVPDMCGGFAVALDREGDDSGIHLEIRLLPQRDPPPGGAVHLRRREQVAVDGRELLDSSAVTVGVGPDTATKWDAGDWKGLVAALRQALDASPDQQFQVRAEVTRGK